MAKRVRIECSEEQAGVITRALDFYQRVCGMGQFGEVADPWLMRCKHDRSTLEVPLRELHALVMPPDMAGYLGASYGIAAAEVPDEYRAAYDMQQVIRYAKWQSRPASERAGYTVDAYPARRTSDNHELATCEVLP